MVIAAVPVAAIPEIFKNSDDARVGLRGNLIMRHYFILLCASNPTYRNYIFLVGWASLPVFNPQANSNITNTKLHIHNHRI